MGDESITANHGLVHEATTLAWAERGRRLGMVGFSSEPYTGLIMGKWLEQLKLASHLMVIFRRPFLNVQSVYKRLSGVLLFQQN